MSTLTQNQNTAKTEPEVVKEEQKVEKPIIQEVIDTKQEPEADTSIFTEMILEPIGVINEPVDVVEHKEGARPFVEDANAELSDEAQRSGILATLKKLFKLILDWINS